MMKKRMKILAAVLLLPLALCLSAGAAETDAQRERDEAALRSAVAGEAQPYLAGTDGRTLRTRSRGCSETPVPDAKRRVGKGGPAVSVRRPAS